MHYLNMFLQSTLSQALGETVADSQVALQLAEETSDKMNLFDMALKGGWIMIVLLLLSILCFYIFFNRLSVYRKATIKIFRLFKIMKFCFFSVKQSFYKRFILLLVKWTIYIIKFFTFKIII